MPKLYKTAQGRTVDIGAIITQNERVRAVGNMNVNARGDVIDNHNQVVSTRPRQVNRNLDSAVDQHIETRFAPQPPDRPVKKSTLEPDQIRKSNTQDSVANAEQPSQGLAAALARANQTKDSQ